MARKKWTANLDTGDDVTLLREKKKWQLALRRYVVDQQKCAGYTRYFGVSSEFFREWIALQFTDDLHWDNYGMKWQFVHLVPVVYFDFNEEQDLLLCWNFTNIRVANIAPEKALGTHTNLLAARIHFQRLFEHSGLHIAQQMVSKLELLEKELPAMEAAIYSFLKESLPSISDMSTLSEDEFNQLNSGSTLADVMLERKILSKFS